MKAYSKEDFTLAEEYVAVAIGMDQLFRRSSDDGEESFRKEGLLPIQLTDVEGKNFDNWKEVIDHLEKLEREYSFMHRSFRKTYMLQQINSVKKIAQWQNGKAMGFPEKVHQFLKVNENPISEEEMEADRHQLDALLTEKGIQENSLSERVQEWESLFLVKNIKEVGDHYLQKAKNQLLEFGFHELEHVSVEFEVVHDVPFNAYCDYLGKKIYINGDLSYTSFQLQHLAVHESFPGHTTHMTIREKLLKEERIPLDAGLVFTNTASSPIFEGIGDNGIRLLGWDKTLDERIFLLLQQIRSKTALNAAYYYHVQNMEKDKVIDYLMYYGFGNKNWASSRFRFISHYFRGPFIYSYWRGQEAVSDMMDQLEPEKYVEFYRFLLENMLCVQSVRYFV